MTLRLTIDERAWRAHLDDVVRATPGLVPVVKGNGYGFGRALLAGVAGALSDEIAVGTLHEVDDVLTTADGWGATIVALTPAIHPPMRAVPAGVVPTVSSTQHLEVLQQHGFAGRVAVKLESSMHRHGVSAGSVASLLGAVRDGGCAIHQFVLHLPLPSAAYTQTHALDEVERWLEHLEPSTTLSLGHLPANALEGLRAAAHPDRRFRVRAGTELWHGDKSFIRLEADVLDVRPVVAGTQLGYRQVPAAGTGHVVLVGAGSAHGVVPLDRDVSPYHHARQRLPLAEPPHMHTSMLLITAGEVVPCIGDWLDVQRPLISVYPDEVCWR